MAGSKPTAVLAVIFAISWLLVLLGTIIIFKFIVPLKYCECFYDNALKGVLALILSGVWLSIMVVMRNAMVRSRILAAKPTATAKEQQS